MTKGLYFKQTKTILEQGKNFIIRHVMLNTQCPEIISWWKCTRHSGKPLPARAVPEMINIKGLQSLNVSLNLTFCSPSVPPTQIYGTNAVDTTLPRWPGIKRHNSGRLPGALLPEWLRKTASPLYTVQLPPCILPSPSLPCQHLFLASCSLCHLEHTETCKLTGEKVSGRPLKSCSPVIRQERKTGKERRRWEGCYSNSVPKKNLFELWLGCTRKQEAAPSVRGCTRKYLRMCESAAGRCLVGVPCNDCDLSVTAHVNNCWLFMVVIFFSF